MKKSERMIIGILAFSFALNIIALPFLPQSIATHWNRYDQADGFMSKAVGLFGFSLIMGFIAVLFIVLPKISGNDKKLVPIMPYYEFFSVWLAAFLLTINIHIVLWNASIIKMPPSLVAAGAIIVLFAGLVIVACFRKKTRISG